MQTAYLDPASGSIVASSLVGGAARFRDPDSGGQRFAIGRGETRPGGSRTVHLVHPG